MALLAAPFSFHGTAEKRCAGVVATRPRRGWYEQWFLKPAKPGGKPLATAMPAEMKAWFEAAKAN